jgi:transposase-like protein
LEGSSEIDENNLKNMEDVGEFISNPEKEMIEAILQGELDAHLGYSSLEELKKA